MPGESTGKCLRQSPRLSFSTWNINGLVDRVLGNKFEVCDFLNHVNRFDFIVLTETWTRRTVFVPNFKCFSSVDKPRSNSSKGRSSGGILVLYKNCFAPHVTLEKRSHNFIWFKVDKTLMGTAEDVFVCGTYIPPENSKHFSPEIFEELEKDIMEFRSKGFLILLGDFNSRTGKYDDHISIEGDNFFTSNNLEESIIPTVRNNYDNVVNSNGKHLLEICKHFDFRILNGRTRGDSMGNITFHGKNGVSTVDYVICDQNLFQKFDYFMVKQPTYLSDHSQISAWLSIPKISDPTTTENGDSPHLKQLPTQFIWSDNSSILFKSELNSQNVQKLINDFLTEDFEQTDTGISIAVSKVESILCGAAKNSLKRKKVRQRRKVTNNINKKWFDKECRFKRHEVRKLANLKRRDPLNNTVRNMFHSVLKEYRNLLKTKQRNYRNEKINQLSGTNVCSQTFWKTFKTLPEKQNQETLPPVNQNELISHFEKLHSKPNMNHTRQRSIVNELKNMERCKTNLSELDYPISDKEIRQAARKLKNKKAAFSDLIKNEMIKASYDILMNVYLKLFNLVLNSGIYPRLWCDGLITPIFKSGDKSDPGNYRGICVSSCLGKLFSSILNERLLDFANDKRLLHPSQIGFLRENRTSDHMITLRALIEKYSSLHKQKVYACFVDFKKAFDSVWHEGLFHRILSYGIEGKVYDLIQSLYTKSTCSIRLGTNRTDSFSYHRGVRQGCILSPLLFNLFINELPLSFDESETDPFTLPNGTKLNSLLYADDLVILSKSKQGLEKCLNILENFNAKWLLDVNYKKTKILIFQKSGRKPKNLSFSINNNPIEIVQEYTYLGIKMTSSGTFTTAQKILAEKALNALFKIQKHIHLSRLPLRSARKIFETVVQPILTYGSEIWGAYIKLDFEKWDKTPIEKAHLRFCKMFLGLNKKASNHATRSEIGNFPVQITIIKQILNYYQYLNAKDDSSVVKQALHIMHEISPKLSNSYIDNIHQILKFCDSACTEQGIAHSVSHIVLQLQSKYSNYWKTKIEASTRLDFFSKIKQEFKEDQFLNDVKNFDLKKDYYKFRTSNHALFIETGRYCRPVLSREKRTCKFCNNNDIEDEMHLLFKCTLYADLRQTFMQNVTTVLEIVPDDQINLTKALFTSKNTTILTANYIHKCFSRRKVSQLMEI